MRRIGAAVVAAVVVLAGLVPGVAASSSGLWTGSDWTNGQTNATGLPCALTNSVNSCFTPGAVFPAAGTEFDFTLVVTAGTATTLRAALRCAEPGTTAVDLLSRTLTKANTTFYVSFTVTTGTNCSYVQAYALSSTGTITFGVGTQVAYSVPSPTAAPGATAPTATAYPQVTPSPGPTSPPATGAGVVCGDGDLGTFSDGTGAGITCGYRSDVSPTLPGALCRSTWVRDGIECMPMPSVGVQAAIMSAGATEYLGTLWVPLTVDPSTGLPAVGLRMEALVQCRDDTHDIDCDMSVELIMRLYHLGTLVNQSTELFLHGSGPTADSFSSIITATTSSGGAVDHVSMQFVCASGATCGSGGATRRTALQYVELRQYYTSASAPVQPNGVQQCLGPIAPGGDPDYCLHGSGGATDPISGKKVCGPLSGDCTKQLVAPKILPFCPAPSNALDVPGWLSFIACTLGNIPGAIWNAVAVPALNYILDIAEPGSGIGLAWNALYTDVNGRVPFSYVGPAVSGVQGFLASPAGADPSLSVTFPTVYGVGGGTFTIPSFGIDSGIRAAMGGLVYFAGALLVLRRVQGGLGGGGGDEE